MEIILIGDSGHAKVIRDCVHSSGDKVIAMLDDKYKEVSIQSDVIKGPIEYVHSLLEQNNSKVVIAIGNNIIRKEIVKRLSLSDSNYATILHKKVIVSDSSQIDVGTVVMPGVTINADCQIGKHCIINSNAVVEHDCIINEYAHISPNCTLTGGVQIGQGVHLGASSTVIPLKSVGNWTKVGAGAVVVNDLPDKCTAVGAPAKPIKFN